MLLTNPAEHCLRPRGHSARCACAAPSRAPRAGPRAARRTRPRPSAGTRSPAPAGELRRGLGVVRAFQLRTTKEHSLNPPRARYTLQNHIRHSLNTLYNHKRFACAGELRTGLDECGAPASDHYRDHEGRGNKRLADRMQNSRRALKSVLHAPSNLPTCIKHSQKSIRPRV